MKVIVRSGPLILMPNQLVVEFKSFSVQERRSSCSQSNVEESSKQETRFL